MTLIPNSVLPTDDSGDNTSGTKWRRVWAQAFKDAIDALTHSITNPTVAPNATTDEVILARAPYGSLKARLDAIVASITGTSTNVDIPILFGASIAAGNVGYISDGTDGRTAGRFYLNTALAPLGSITAVAMTSTLVGVSGTIRILGEVSGLAGLTAGTIYYASLASPGLLTNVAPANALIVGQAISTTELVVTGNPPVASDTKMGILSLLAQDIAGAKRFITAPTFAPGTVAKGLQDAIVSGVIHKNGATVNSSTGGPISPINVTIKGNLLNADGKLLRVTLYFRTAANVNNKQITAVYGGTTVFDSGVFTTAGAANHGKLIIEIMRTGASAQRVCGMESIGINTAGSGFGAIGLNSTAAKDNTVDQVLTVIFATAVANADLIHDGSYIEVLG